MSSASTITRSPTPAGASTESRASSTASESIPETRQGSKWTADEVSTYLNRAVVYECSDEESERIPIFLLLHRNQDRDL